MLTDLAVFFFYNVRLHSDFKSLRHKVKLMPHKFISIFVNICQIR